MVTASAQNGSCSRGHRAVCAAAMQTALRCLEGRWKMMIVAHLSAELEYSGRPRASEFESLRARRARIDFR
jgi:hypothetical protein